MSSTLAREDAANTFEQLYQRHRADVYRFVLRDVRNPADAEDVTQTAFLNAYRALQHGDHPEKPRAWLLTIAQNVTRRRFRSRSARPQEVELDPDTVVAPEPDGPSGSEIREALKRLRPNHRVVLVLREIGGLSYAEIAETMDLSQSAVETLIFRARRALREELTEGADRHPLRVGGLVLPLPFGLSHGLGSLVGWLGRRAGVVQAAAATGAAVIGVGVAVQAGLPGEKGPQAPAAERPTPAVVGANAHAARTRVAGPRREQAATRPRRAASGRTDAGGSGGPTVADIRLPGVPAVQLPSAPPVQLPDVPVTGLDVPAVDVPGVSVPALDLPAVQPPTLPELPLPEVESPQLP